MLATAALLICSCQGRQRGAESPLAGDPDRAQVPALVAEPFGNLSLYPENPRYFEYKGKPVILITSAEHYGAVLNLDFDYKLYLETLSKEGFNYTRIFAGTYLEPVDNIFGIEKNTLAPQPDRYIAPWEKENGKYDLEQFNPEFFVRLKDFISEAREREIIVEVTLFSSIYAENAWDLCPFNGRNNVNGVGDISFKKANTLDNGGLLHHQEMFVRKVVGELKEFENIFYEVQNEPWADNGSFAGNVNQEDDVFSRPWQKKVEVASEASELWQAYIIGTIYDEESLVDGGHLIAQNICNFQFDVKELPNLVSVLNFHYALPGAVHMNADLGGVIGLDETGFMPQGDNLYLHQAWRMILSGAGLYNNLDYSFTAGNETGEWPIAESNPGWGGPGFREKLGILVKTINQVPFHEMEFSDGILGSPGDGVKQYGLQKPGEVYLVFIEHLDGTRLVPLVPAGAYGMTWINVGSGETRSSGQELGGGISVTSPFGEDHVALLLKNIE